MGHQRNLQECGKVRELPGLGVFSLTLIRASQSRKNTEDKNALQVSTAPKMGR